MAWSDLAASLHHAADVYARNGWRVELTLAPPAAEDELRRVPLRALRELFAGSRSARLWFEAPSGCQYGARHWPMWDLDDLQSGFEAWHRFARHRLDICDQASTRARESQRVSGRLPLVAIENGNYIVCANDGTDVVYIDHECGHAHGRQLAPTAEAFFERWFQLGAIDALCLPHFLGRDGLDPDGPAARAWWRMLGAPRPKVKAPPSELAQPAIHYTAATRFAVGDLLIHPTLGKGRVLAAHADRIDVQFADRKKRTLVHAR
jgi:hypothetical protein